MSKLYMIINSYILSDNDNVPDVDRPHNSFLDINLHEH